MSKLIIKNIVAMLVVLIIAWLGIGALAGYNQGRYRLGGITNPGAFTLTAARNQSMKEQPAWVTAAPRFGLALISPQPGNELEMRFTKPFKLELPA